MGANGYFQIEQAIIEDKCGKTAWRDLTSLLIIPKPETSIEPFNSLNFMELNKPLIRDIYRWAEKTMAKDLTLEKLASQLNQTPCTLSRKIKTNTGLSCVKFLRLIKLSQVGQQLKYSDKSVQVISCEYGFSDDTALRHSFKKETGYTPLEYRNLFSR